MLVYAVTYLTCVLESEQHDFDFQAAGAGVLQSLRAELPDPQQVGTVLVPALPGITDCLEDPRAMSMANMLNLPKGRRMVPCRSLHERTYDRIELNREIGRLAESSRELAVVVLMPPSIASDLFRKEVGPAQVCVVRIHSRASAGAARRSELGKHAHETVLMGEDQILGAAERTVRLRPHEVDAARQQVTNLRIGIELAQRSINDNSPVEIPFAAMQELMAAPRAQRGSTGDVSSDNDEPPPIGIPLSGRIFLWCMLIGVLTLMLWSAALELIR